MKRGRCNCSKPRQPNARRNNIPIIIWECPLHGKLFEECARGIKLTEFQQAVLSAVKENKSQNFPCDADSISKIVNATFQATTDAIRFLTTREFIK